MTPNQNLNTAASGHEVDDPQGDFDAQVEAAFSAAVEMAKEDPEAMARRMAARMTDEQKAAFLKVFQPK